MCTLGAISNVNPQGKRLSFLFKTIDAGYTEITHGLLNTPSGTNALFSSIMRQPGTNIGLNNKGLGITISYSDCWSPEETGEMPNLEGDTRALANAEALERFQNVQEVVDFLQTFVREHPDQIGGNHLILDAEGNIALLEQYKGRSDHCFYTDQGFCARSNNSHWLIREEQSKLYPPQDSWPREEITSSFLKETSRRIAEGAEASEIVELIKKHLSTHSENENQIASICVHGLDAPGARLFGFSPCYSLTGVILDISNLEMHYSMGQPCSSEWKHMSFDS